ncbi:MAG TPA: flagellar hook-length control protein FliK [Steroidobacteraceae bacterium]|nr:flagellar hook-length control protein FliK [Steroidobacteraceae bacterium]
MAAGAGDSPIARQPGVFDPLIKTAHRVLDLLQPLDVDRMDPVCAAPAPTPTPATDATQSTLAPVVATTAAIAQAAPDMLAALMKRMTEDGAARDAAKPSNDTATFMPLVERTDDTGGAAPSGSPAIKTLIDALPKPGVLDQPTDAAREVAGARPGDTPSAALFIDGHAMRAHSAPAEAAAQNLKLDVPMRSPEWAHALGEKITWLVDQNLASAQIKLNPPQLGPIEVRIAISGDNAQVSVSAHNGITRDALEAAAPRLRDALTSHGFGGVSVDISQHSFSDRAMPQSAPERWEAWQSITADNDTVRAVRPQPWRAAGRLDAYA